jgi:exodeoxyribonuclease VII small subunit
MATTKSAGTAGADDAFADVAELSYEQARDELVTIVAQLEGGQLGLEESMRLWQRGEALAAHCSTWLDGAEAALTREVAPGD